jgi:hypothetical protein
MIWKKLKIFISNQKPNAISMNKITYKKEINVLAKKLSPNQKRYRKTIDLIF